MNDRGPFDRMLDNGGAPGGDRNGRLFLVGLGVLGIILLVLFGPPFHLLSGGGSSTSSGGSTGKTPDGFQALSRTFTPEKPKGTNGPYNLTLNLLASTTDARNIGIYTSVNGKYERIGAATLTNNGTAATGQVPDIPPNVVVLRRTSGGIQITGWLPAGGSSDPAALAVLGTIDPVDYTPKPDGTLNGTPTQVPATKGGIAPTVRASQQADVDAVNTILQTPATRDAHIAALVALAGLPGNTGIDIDYEKVQPARKADFTAFVLSLADKLHAANKTLSITLPTPVKTGVSWDTGAYDWEQLAKSADTVKLIAEPDPSLYYQKMTDVLSYLKGKTDLRRVSLVVTRQGVSKGNDGLQPVSLKTGLTLASAIEVRTQTPVAPNSSVIVVGKNIFQDDGASGVHWDDAAEAVSFAYPGTGGQRTVWLENTFSLGFRLDLARRFGLGGVTVDDVSANPDLPPIWPLLQTYSDTGTVQLVLPNGALLRPTWTVQAGSSEPGAKGNVVWKAPAQPGTYDVSLIVSDGVVRATQKVSLAVSGTAASGTPTSGTPASGTPASGTPASGTPRATTTASGTPTATGTARATVTTTTTAH